MNCALLFLNLLQPPPQSSRPPVVGYNVLYNASGAVGMNVTNNAKFVIKIIPPEVVVFTVNAMNVLGNGKDNSITSELLFIYTSQTIHCFKTHIL